MDSQAVRQRARRSDGLRTRNAILDEAARLATVEGLDGLSLGRLADRVGMSKSGLFAHFGSKEELQLATVARATEIFDELVVAPASSAATGLGRLDALVERFLGHVEERVFPGGCFFASAAAELDTRSGPVRDRALGMVASWVSLLERAVRDAQAEGALRPEADPVQLAFEVQSHLLHANASFVAGGGADALARGRGAIRARLERELTGA